MPAPKLTLRHPIADLRGEITVKELQFKYPKARLFRQFGSPQRLSQTQNVNKRDEIRIDVIVDEDVYCQFLAEMVGLDISQIEDLSAPDYESAKAIAWQMINGAITDDKGNPTL